MHTTVYDGITIVAELCNLINIHNAVNQELEHERVIKMAEDIALAGIACYGFLTMAGAIHVYRTRSRTLFSFIHEAYVVGLCW